MSRKPTSKRTRHKPKAVLRLPDLDQAKSAVLNSLTSADAQRGYRHAIDEFVEWYCSEPRLSFSRTVVLRYRIHLEARHLAPGTINLRLGAVRRLAYEAADCGLLRPDLAAGIRMPDSLLRKALSPRLSHLVHPTKQLSRCQVSSFDPLVQKLLHPYRHRDSTDMPGFSFQIDDGPVLFTPLNVAEVQFNGFMASNAAS